METKKRGLASDKAIFLDRDFNKMLDDNAETAWLEYCQANGLDPNVPNDGQKDSDAP